MFIKVNGMVYSTEGIKNFGSHSVAGKEELVLTFRNGNSVEVREMDKVRRDFPKCSFFTAMAAITERKFYSFDEDNWEPKMESFLSSTPKEVKKIGF